MLKLGMQGIAAVYVGGQKITKAYLGDSLVFGASAPPEPITYTISLSVDPQGGGAASGGGTIEEGTQVTVTAAPADGYTFSGWRENGTIVSTSASYTFTVIGDRSLTAVFAAVIPSYTVTTSIDPTGSGTAAGAGTYQQGASVTVTAAPGDGYKFVKWAENGQTVSETASYTFTVGGDRALVAVFEADKVSRLPAGYTEVEWISSYKGDSTYSSCYIKPKDLAKRSTLKLEIDAQIMQNISSNMAFSSAYAGSSYYQCFMRYRNNSFYAGATYFSSSSNTTGTLIGSSDLTRKLYILDILGKKASVESVSKSIPVNVSNEGELSLFGGDNSPARARYFGGKIYSSGVITHEFIPCIKDGENIAGLYDIIQNVFYKSEGYTEYDAGPAV